MAPVIEDVKRLLGDKVYGVDTPSLEDTAMRLLLSRGETFSAAESCTGGLIAKRLTDVPGASAVFECGVVSYANEVKKNLLGVKAETIEQFTEVSRECAAEMAQGVRRLSGADYGVSVTGFAGPDSAPDGRPAGLIYVGVSSEHGTAVREVNTGRGGEGSRDYNRTVAASNALHLALEEMRR